jgi:hypothetical protein
MTAVVDQRKAARRKKPKKRAYAAGWSGRPAAMEFCQCARCDSKVDWPAYYVGSGRLYMRKDGRRRGLRYNRSYECYLERNPPNGWGWAMLRSATMSLGESDPPWSDSRRCWIFWG